jgi:hypothetical protein
MTEAWHFVPQRAPVQLHTAVSTQKVCWTFRSMILCVVVQERHRGGAHLQGAVDGAGGMPTTAWQQTGGSLGACLQNPLKPDAGPGMILREYWRSQHHRAAEGSHLSPEVVPPPLPLAPPREGPKKVLTLTVCRCIRTEIESIVGRYGL